MCEACDPTDNVAEAFMMTSLWHRGDSETECGFW